MKAGKLPLLTRALVEGEEFRESHRFIELPKENAFDLPVKYLQIGIGGYIRGHADYFLDVLGEGRIIAVQPNSVEVPRLLKRQDGLYTLVSVSGTEERPDYRYRIISCIAKPLAARVEWEEVMKAVSSHPLELILMVVTEQGVKTDESDTDFEGFPKSAIGKLTKILYTQWLHFPEAKITVLDTDNVSDNGRVVRNSVMRMVEDIWRGQLDDRFKGWLSSHVAFPISLCDRMVPGGRGRISDERMRGFWDELGYRDECLITAEPFRMWVIEDWFAGARPDFERAGVKVRITIYDSAGNLIRTIELGRLKPGYYIDKGKAAYWDGRNELGEKVASGVYLYQIQAGSFRKKGRMVLLK